MKSFVRWGIAVLVTGVLLALVASFVLRLSYYRIVSDSMAPDFPAGTIVIDSGLLPIEPHRAITFTADGKTVTHVFMGYNKDGSLLTRGIANPVADHPRSPVHVRDVKGRVLLRLLPLAPVFWLSRQGEGVAAGVGLALLAAYLWRRVSRESYPRLQSSSK